MPRPLNWQSESENRAWRGRETGDAGVPGSYSPGSDPVADIRP